MEFNDSFFEEIGRSAGVSAMCEQAIDAAAARARASAPVDSGAYRDGLVKKKKYQKRVVWMLVGTDWKTLLIEAKTGNLKRSLKGGKGG